MKKTFFTLFILFSIFSNAQVINVSPNTNSTTLVNSVLLNGACVGATNVTARTGTNFGSFNGIGSFTNTNPSFPMTKGVILSTGNVASSAGPNATSLDEGSTTWSGDANLVAALANPAATYLNASVLEFDFTPVSPNFSFDFIFASEEYGGYQCAGFPDAFAFLLTNTSSNTTTNLAVLPSLNIPITTEQVRDNAYNSTCVSNNANFFGNFYGGSNGNISPTNFNGETKLLTASSTLIPGIVYHIKLVIADRNDVKYDSAVFISGTSFNIGQDVLGPDATVANGNAACFGANYTISSGLNPLLYDFVWSKVGNSTTLGTSASLIVNGAGNYQLSYNKKLSGCVPEINTINIEFYPEILTIAPLNIIKCEVVGATSYTFDIAQNTAILLAGLPVLPTATTTISYFFDNLCTSPISSPYTVNSSTPNQTVFVKITNTLTNCFTIKPFVLLTSPKTTITPITGGSISVCEETAGSGTKSVIFNSYDVSFLGTQPLPQFDVSYYLTTGGANNGTGQISKTGYTVSNGTTIWVRVENKTDKNCFETSSFLVNVIANPVISDAVADVFVCTKYVLPNLTSPNAQYWSGDNGTGTNYPFGTTITKPATVNFVDIYIYLNTPNCPAKKSFRITFIDVNDVVPPIINNCDKFIVPILPYGDFYTASHLNGGNGGTKLIALSELTSPQSQTIYFYFVSVDEANCEIEIPYVIKIDPSPVLPDYENIYKCIGEFYTLLPIDRIKNPVVNYYSSNNFIPANIIPEGTKILATKTIYVHAESGLRPCTDDAIFTVYVGLPNPTAVLSCENYQLPVLPVGKYYPNAGGPSATNIEIAVGFDYTSSVKIYHYAKSDPNDLPVSVCVFDEPLNIKIVLPIVPTSINLNITACGIYNLPTLPIVPINTSVSPNQSYQQFSYNTKADGTGINVNSSSIVSVSQTIYVFVGDGTCKRGVPMVIDIKPYPVIPLSPIYPKCENFSLTKPANVEFYYGPNRTKGIIPDNTIFTQDIRIYAYSETSATPPCGLDYPIDIQIYFTKAIQYPNIAQCSDFTLPTIIQPNTDDNNAYYSGSRLNNGTSGQLLPSGTIFKTTETLLPNGTVLPVIQNVYVYNIKTVRFTCEDETVFKVIIDPNPDVPTQTAVIACDSYVLPIPAIGNYFTESHSINPTGGNLILPNTIISKTKKIYVFAGNSALAGCATDEEPLQITINKVDKLGDVVQCENYILPFLNIDDVPQPLEGDYYTQSGGPTGTGTRLTKGTVVTPTSPLVIGTPSTTTIRRFYIYKQYPSTLDVSGFCSSETYFDVTIITKPSIATIPLLIDRTFCDDIDNDNDGKRIIDLQNYNTTIFGTSQVGSEFTIAYYNSLADANTNTNPITVPTEFDNLKNIFVRVNNTLAISCFATGIFQLIINKLPEPTAKDGVICEDNKTGLIINPYTITTGLNTANFTFIWKDATNLEVGNSNNLIVSVPGIYSLDIKNNTTLCSIPTKFITVKLSRIALASYSLSENFNDNQFITITAIGDGGDYEYQLDESGFQDSNIFTEAPFGNHIITVRDKNGCGLTTIPIVVVNYPKYFTPNDDNFNDTWNVIGLEKQLQANIYIYDQYGKLLKQMPTNSIGWDGKLNGELLPATDYWFTISYLEDGVDKLFKSHFSLKR